MLKAIFPFYISLSFFLLWWMGLSLGGNYIALTIIMAFVILPVLDVFFGINPHNESEEVFKTRKTYLWLFDLVLYFYIIGHIIVLFLGPYLTIKNNFTNYELISAAIATGTITGGFGITIAHELCHRPSTFQRFLGDFILSSVCYTHFSTEHVFGHHNNVGTFHDPATARFNEGFYRFFLRALWSGFLSSLRIKKMKTMLGVLVSGGWAITMYFLFYEKGAIFFFIQSVTAFSLLELVNYVEHYGLERKKLENGRHEKVRPIHSWNSSHILSNWYLFNLERHSDHHAYVNRPYPLLRHHSEAPQLPAGYDTMVILALVPPIWFKIMNPKVAPFRVGI